MLYRGFQIDTVATTISSRWNSTTERLDQCPSVICEVYDQYDDGRAEYLESFTLAEGYEVLDFSVEQIQKGMREYVDKYDTRLNRERNEMLVDRKNKLLGRLASRLGEGLEPVELYDLLSENVGMTDEEIRACGYQSLSPFFDRPAYAQTVAEYMIQVGTEETTTGNWHFYFTTLNIRFGLDLKNDEEMVQMIRNELYKQIDIVNDVDIYDDDFDVLFYPENCPFADEEESVGMAYNQQL